MPVLVPPLEEQERIVEILEDQLSRLDTALQSVRTVREKAAQFRRSLLHAAFTGALTGHDVKDGELPEGWRRLELGVLGKWTTGSTPSTRDPENFDGDVPFVGPGDIGYGNLLGNVQRSLSAQGQKKARIVEPPSVLLVCIGATLGKVSLAMRRVATNQQINALEVGEDLSPSFVMHLLASPSLQESLWSTSSSTTVPIINKKTLQGVEVPIPPLGEQERIVEIVEEQLSRLDASLAVADAVEERSAALRRSLLYSAFTGRLTEEWREAVNV